MRIILRIIHQHRGAQPDQPLHRLLFQQAQVDEEIDQQQHEAHCLLEAKDRRNLGAPHVQIVFQRLLADR